MVPSETRVFEDQVIQKMGAQGLRDGLEQEALKACEFRVLEVWSNGRNNVWLFKGKKTA